MKIRIITIHGIPNFGSVFQCYALCKHLENEGYTDVKVIDYNPEYFRASSLKSKIARLLNYGNYKRRTRKFRNFVENNIPLTNKAFCSVEQLKAAKLDADVYIAGGDQLWNVYHACGRDDAYKLTWTSGKKISYGTSLGQADFPSDELKELAEKIRDFSAVSVRESSSATLLARENVTATHCVDPVFLLNAADYERFLPAVNEPKYLLVYLVTPSPLLNKAVKYLSEKYNLKVILCSGFSRKCCCDKFIKDAGPSEILSYVKNAEIVLSASFHATAFSVIFKKQFFTILPGEHTNERITDFLSYACLSDRIVTEKSLSENVLDGNIDYSAPTKYGEKIAASKEYLKKALSDTK